VNRPLDLEVKVLQGSADRGVSCDAMTLWADN